MTCVGWSAEGLQQQRGHESEVPLAIWLAERVHRQSELLEDIAFLECTPRFPGQERLSKSFGDAAHVFSIVTCPSDHGWPHRRRRILAAVINKKTLQWQGARSVEEVQADFKRRFHRSVGCSAGCLLVADRDEQIKELYQFASQRCNNVSLEDITALFDAQNQEKLEELCFPPGAIERLAAWRKHLGLEECDENEKWQFCDVDHNVHSRGPAAGELWPTQLTHGTVMAFLQNRWRLATGMEHYAALGFNSHSHMPNTKSSRLMSLISQLPPIHQKQLSGNAMHLETQASWMLYILAHVSRHQRGSSSLTRIEQKGLNRFSSWELDEADMFE